MHSCIFSSRKELHRQPMPNETQPQKLGRGIGGADIHVVVMWF